MTEQQLIVALGLLMIILSGIFLWQAGLIWLKNKREEREFQIERAEIRKWDANKAEREEWVGLISDKDTLINQMNEKIVELSKQVERNKMIMTKFNMKGELIDGTEH